VDSENFGGLTGNYIGAPLSLSLGQRRIMKDTAIVFDTNACRDICDSTQVADPASEWTKYDKCLRSRGIVSFANPYVFMELMGHLADQSDPAFNECRLAVVALYNLSASNPHQVRILSDSETLILRALYGRTLPETDQTTQRICTLALYVVENTPNVLDLNATAVLQEIRNHLSKVEQQFISDVWQYVVQELNPSSTGWVPLENDEPMRNVVLNILRSATMQQTIATAFVLKAMHQAQVIESTAEIVAKAHFVSTTFPAAIHLYREILKRIVETGCNLNKKKRANWIWDIQIVMGVGQQIATVNKPLHLVTTDGDIVTAAETAGCRQFVHSLSEFKTMIGI
jgi:hypothetical protein